jgi:hypothetical protein
MKFSIKNITMAALALMTTACSSDINELIQNEEQPAYSNGVITVTGQLAPKKALTRALSEGKDAENKDIIVADWKVDETLAVIYLTDESKREMGKATITEVDPTTGAANFVFNLENGTQIHQHPECTIIYPYKAALDDATGVKTYDEFLGTQDGTLSPNLDVRVGEGIISDVVGHVGSATATLTVTKQPEVKYAIFKFNLSDGSSPIQSCVFSVKEDGNLITTATTTSLYEVYVALPPSSAGTVYTFTAIAGTDMYTKTLTTNKAINKGEYYETTLTMTGTDKKVNLSTLSINHVAQDYEVLTGTLANNVQISIADGATVLLDGAKINANGTWTTGNYAGLTCEGNATIILTGGTSRENIIKGFDNSYPGIYVPTGKTLTILGTNNDYLTVSSNGYGAGIGGGNGINCGNIVIKGGKITATGGIGAAGIGGGCGDPITCGNIIITGGIIEATGGSGAVGIGSGQGTNNNSTCGSITFTNTLTSLKSVAGTSANYTVGASVGGSCGTITIGGTVREQSSFAVGYGDASKEFNYLP